MITRLVRIYPAILCTKWFQKGPISNYYSNIFINCLETIDKKFKRSFCFLQIFFVNQSMLALEQGWPMRGPTAIFGPLALQEWPMKTFSVIQTEKLKDKLPTCKSPKITEFLARQRLFQKFGSLSLIDLDVGPFEKKVGHPCLL